MRGCRLLAVFAAVAVSGCGGREAAPQPQRATPAPARATADGPRAPEASRRQFGNCPVTGGARRAKGVGISLGDGPAYPVLGMIEAPPAPGGVAMLSENERHGSVYRVKTLWAVAPGAPSDLVVRGASLRTGAPLRFLVPAGPAAARRGRSTERLNRVALPATDGEWTYAPGVTLLPGPGCYAFRLIGNGVHDEIVFRAALSD